MIARRHVPARLRVPLVALLSVVGIVAGLAAIAPPATAAGFYGAGKFPGLGSGKLWALAISPNDSKLVLAATDQGVFRSTDGGNTWSATSIQGVRAWCVGFDARASHEAYAGLDGRGVSRSSDGKTWSDASAGLTDTDVRALAFGLEGIAAGTHSGVAVSSDGQHWRGAGLDGYGISSLVVSANQPQLTLVAGVDNLPSGAQSSGFLFRNSGGALNWDTLQQGLPSSTFVSSLTAGPLPSTGQPRPLVATTTKGVYHSGDGGTTWTSSTGVPDQTNLTVTSFSPLDPNLVYAGADAGGSSGGALMRSTDSGASFNPVADGLPDGRRNVDAIAVGPATPPVVMVGVNPPASFSQVFLGLDSAAPTPGGTSQDSAGALLSSAAPTPKPHATAHAVVPPVVTPPSESTGFRHFLEVVVRFPFPLMLELLAIVLAVYIVMRWRQRYLDVEGPP